MTNNIKNLFVSENESLKSVLKKLGKTATKVLVVVDGKKRLLGTVSDGDIRRYLLTGKDLNTDIAGIYKKEPIYFKKDEFTNEQAKQIFLKHKITLIPITSEDNKVIDFISWEELFS